MRTAVLGTATTMTTAPPSPLNQRIAALIANARVNAAPRETGAAAPAVPLAPLNPGLFDGVSIHNPFDAITQVLTNAMATVTGVHDERYGAALEHAGLAVERFGLGVMRSMSRGSGVVAEGSSILGKVLPLFNVANGVADVVKGWHSLAAHPDGPLSIIHSKVGREGLLDIVGGALLLVPGVGGFIASAVLAAGNVANDLDVFRSLDQPLSAAAQAKQASDPG